MFRPFWSDCACYLDGALFDNRPSEVGQLHFVLGRQSAALAGGQDSFQGVAHHLGLFPSERGVESLEISLDFFSRFQSSGHTDFEFGAISDY